MKQPKVRQELLSKFSSGVFTLDEAVEVCESHFHWNEKEARERDLRNFTRRQIRNVKDGNGVRSIIAFNMSEEHEPRQMAFQRIETCSSPEILARQNDQIWEKIDGMSATSEKINRRMAYVGAQMAPSSIGASTNEEAL